MFWQVLLLIGLVFTFVNIFKRFLKCIWKLWKLIWDWWLTGGYITTTANYFLGANEYLMRSQL